MVINIRFNTYTKTFRYTFLGALMILSVIFFITAAYSWTGPSSSPPENNVAAPINVSATSQVKEGPLSVDGLSVYGSEYISDNLGIGTSPSSNWKVYARGGTSGVYADTTTGQAIRGAVVSGGTGYAGYFDASDGDSSAGGLFARNGAGYYAYIGYPGTAWSLYSNGNSYTAGYSRADGGFCIAGSCKTTWTPSATTVTASCTTTTSSRSCTVATGHCPSGYVRSGCSARSSVTGMYNGASPYSTDRCYCDAYNSGGGSGKLYCYSYCIR